MSDTESVESTSDYVSDSDPELEQTFQIFELHPIELDPGFDSTDGYLTEVYENFEPQQRRIVRRHRRHRPIRQRQNF